MWDKLQADRHELLIGLLGLTKKLADNQEVMAKNHQKLQVRVERLETWCTSHDVEIARNKSQATQVQQAQDFRMACLETICALQDKEIALLGARISAACGMLNLE